jgi:hypothetical protein
MSLQRALNNAIKGGTRSLALTNSLSTFQNLPPTMSSIGTRPLIVQLAEIRVCRAPSCIASDIDLFTV